MSTPKENPGRYEIAIRQPASASFDDIDHANNPHPRCPIAILLDTSGSMAGQPLQQMQDAVRKFFIDLASDDIAMLRSEIALYTFGGSVTRQYSLGDELDADSLPTFKAEGSTPLGIAVVDAIEHINERRRVYKDHAIQAYAPWVVIVSDGAPDEGWEDAASALRALSAGKWQVICVGVDNARVDILSQFSTSPVLRMNNLQFAPLFRWLSDSLRSLSRSTPGQGCTLSPVNWNKNFKH